MDSGDIPKDLFEGLTGGSTTPTQPSAPPATTASQESVQAPINIITNPALREEDVGQTTPQVPPPPPRRPLPPPVVSATGDPISKPKATPGAKKFGKAKWAGLARQAAQQASVINPPPPVPVIPEHAAAVLPVPVVALPVVPTHSTHQPALVVPCSPDEPKPKPPTSAAPRKKLSFLSVVQAARAKAQEGLHEVLDTGYDGSEGIIRGEEPVRRPSMVRGEAPATVVRTTPPQSPALSSYARFP